MRIHTEEQDKAEVSMSPLIDCVFLLLIFFLVATIEKKENRDISILLPESQAAERLPPDDEQLIVGIDEGGHFYLDGRVASRAKWQAALRDLAQLDPQRRIRVDADELTSVEHIAEIAFHCQKLGLSNLGFRTYDDQYNRR
ncbi:MAG: biopolymer transporter ExbD [Planctomycetota bacterium]